MRDPTDPMGQYWPGWTIAFLLGFMASSFFADWIGVWPGLALSISCGATYAAWEARATRRRRAARDLDVEK